MRRRFFEFFALTTRYCTHDVPVVGTPGTVFAQVVLIHKKVTDAVRGNRTTSMLPAMKGLAGQPGRGLYTSA